MGRHSDSEDDRKKRKKKKKRRSRSRSRSSSSIESRQSSKHKKTKKSRHKHRSRSRSPERSRRRSRSYDRYRSRSRSRSYGRRSRSRDRYSRRSRSRSRSRYSRSRSRSRDRRRKRSRDRGSKRSRSRSKERKDSKRETKDERDDPCANIPGFSDMTPAEQARIRMNMALRAAAAADEKIKEGEIHKSSSSASFEEQLKFSQAVQDIEATGFAAAAFKSNRGDKKEEKPVNLNEFTFGTAGELRLDMAQRKPVIIDVDNDELAHPNFHVDTEVKMDRWIQKLNGMRKRKLEGEVIT